MVLISLLSISNNQQSNKDILTNDKAYEGEFAQLLGSVLSGVQSESGNQMPVIEDQKMDQADLLALLNSSEWDDLPEEWQMFMYIDLRDESLFQQKASDLLNIEVDQLELILTHMESFLTTNEQVQANGELLATSMNQLSKLVALQEETDGQIANQVIGNKTVIQMVKLLQMMNQQTQPAPFNQQKLDTFVKELMTLITVEEASILSKASTSVKDTHRNQAIAPNMVSVVPHSKVEQSKMGEDVVELQSKLQKMEGQTVDGKSSQPQTSVTSAIKNDLIHISMQQNGKQVSSEQLIKQFEHTLSRSKFTVVNGIQKLSIQLTPEHLGTIRIEIVQKENTMIARIIATTQAAKEAFESSANSLRQAFHSQNITVDKIEIYQTSLEKHAEESLNNGENNQANPEEQHSQQKNDKDADTRSFLNELEAELLNLKV